MIYIETSELNNLVYEVKSIVNNLQYNLLTCLKVQNSYTFIVILQVVVLNVNDVKSLEFAIVENVQRQDLNPVEEAQGYQRLIDDFNYNQDKLSQFIGKSRSYIANSLRLLSLPGDVLLMVEKGNLSAGHARTLIGLNNSVDIAK